VLSWHFGESYGHVSDICSGKNFRGNFSRGKFARECRGMELFGEGMFVGKFPRRDFIYGRGLTFNGEKYPGECPDAHARIPVSTYGGCNLRHPG